ncbi:anaerobic sulfite reductase subunit AsrA [Cetobacterium ceti]
MAYRMNWDTFQEFLENLSSNYEVYAPKKFPAQGRYSDSDIVRYSKISGVDEIEFKDKSHYPVKEVFQPITETVLYFTDDDYREPKNKFPKKNLIFARACDLHAMKRFDDIYLKNGGFEDSYYKSRRENSHFILMECPENGWDTCFCVSAETNIPEEYSLGIKFLENEILLDVKDEEFRNYLNNLDIKEETFEVQPVMENKRVVEFPEIPNKDIQQQVKSLEMWNEFDKRCLACGSCTIACSTCTCFTTYDMNYSTDTNAGERRRIAASCHVDGFTDMAGGHSFRQKAGERMRFKVMHKVHDHKARFKDYNMCVGCGRCDDRCPVFISFSTTVNKLTEEVKKLVAGGNK